MDPEPMADERNAPASHGDDSAATVDIAAERPSFYGHVLATAVLSGFFALAWFLVYELLSEFVWDNDFVVSTWWVYPLIILPFSLAVGFAVKYLDAPTSISGSPLDELTGDPQHIEWRKLPATVVMSLISLLAGAVVGPEGALGRFAAQIAAWYGQRFYVPAAMRGRLVFASAASAYNGLLENPIFTAVLAGDMARGTPGIWTSMPANLMGGAIGFAIFQLLGGAGVADFLQLGPVPEGAIGDVLWVMGFALVGMLLAVFAGLSMQIAGTAFARLDGRPVTRALVAGLVLSSVGLAAPILLFSGETQIGQILDDPSSYGFWALVALALAKLVLLAISFKSGFLGGPTFPIIFAATCIALAIDQIVPAVPFVLVEAGVLAGALMTMFRTPLMVVLLTSFFLGANTELVAMIVAAVVMVVVLLPFVESGIASARAKRGAS